MCPGSLVGATVLCREVGWHCTVAVSAGCSPHQLPGCKSIGNRSCAPLGHQNSVCIGIYGHMQPYIQAFTCIYKFQTYIYIIPHLLGCLFVPKCFYIRKCMRIYMYFGLYLVLSYIIAPLGKENRPQLQGSYVKLLNASTMLARHCST